MKSSLSQKQKDILSRLGLSEIQTQLYVTSLKHGVLSVLELSKLTKISRQQIYSEAAKLIELGLYEKTRRQGVKYVAASPARVEQVGVQRVAEANKTLSDVALLMPQLKAITKQSKSDVVTKYYEGLSKIRAAYDAELAASKNTEVLSLVGSIDNTFDFFPESYWDTWNKRFVKSNSRSRMIVHKTDAARNTAIHDSKYKRETRWLNDFPLKVNIDVFNNTVLIVSFHDKIAIWIESGVLAESYRILFNTLWGLAKRFED